MTITFDLDDDGHLAQASFIGYGTFRTWLSKLRAEGHRARIVAAEGSWAPPRVR